MRDVLEGPVSAHDVFVVVVATLMYTGCALVAAASIFRREAIMLGDVGIGGLFTRVHAREQSHVPRLGEAFALVTLIFLLYFYVGSMLQVRFGVAGIVLSQWGLLLLPALLILRWKGLSLARSFAWNAPKVRHFVGGVLLGCSLWYPLMLAARWIMAGDVAPGPSASEDLLGDLVSDTPVWQLLAVLALTPAICEELLFRGVFLSSLRDRMRPIHAALLCGFLFGAFHLSLVGFVPKTILGIVLSLMVLQCGSVWPAIAFHAIHNGISLLIVRYSVSLPGIVDDAAPVLWQLALACAACVLGVILLARRPTGDSSS
jgi:sodium transport system permease protein